MNATDTVTSFYTGLNYSTKLINQNFRIKVNGNVNGIKINQLVGVAGLIDLIDDIELVNRLIERAYNSPEYSIPCKLRRGIKITFYSK